MVEDEDDDLTDSTASEALRDKLAAVFPSHTRASLKGRAMSGGCSKFGKLFCDGSMVLACFGQYLVCIYI